MVQRPAAGRCAAWVSYRFTVLDIVAEPYAAAPQLTARLRIEETTGQRVHAIALRCQVRIEPQRAPLQRRPRQTGCGAVRRAGRGGRDTLRPFLWMQCNTTVQGFTGRTEVDLALPCTYDFDVTGSRYLHALGAGDVPLALLFSGTVFTRGEHGFGVRAGAVGLRGRLRAAGRGVAADDRVATTRTPAGSGSTATCSPRSPTTGPGTA